MHFIPPYFPGSHLARQSLNAVSLPSKMDRLSDDDDDNEDKETATENGDQGSRVNADEGSDEDDDEDDDGIQLRQRVLRREQAEEDR